MRWAPLLLMFASATAWAGMPSWAKGQSLQHTGSILRVVCQGEGPAVDIARATATRSCQATAADQLVTSIHVKSVSVETEDSIGLHQEVRSEKKVQRVGCKVLREEIQEREGSFVVWQQCAFDLSKAKVEVVPAQDERASRPSASRLDLTRVKPRGSPESSGLDPAKLISSKHRSISLAIVPPCDSIMVQGNAPRVIRCDGNPITLLIDEGDRELLVRAKGHEPKPVKLDKLGEEATHEIDVVLDPL